MSGGRREKMELLSIKKIKFRKNQYLNFMPNTPTDNIWFPAAKTALSLFCTASAFPQIKAYYLLLSLWLFVKISIQKPAT